MGAEAGNAGGANGGSGNAGGAAAASGGAPAGAQSGGAANGAGTQGQAGSAASGTPAEWTTGLNDEFKGFVQNKGWKAPAEVLDSYRNLEKLLGAPQDQVIRLPKADDAQAWDGVFSKLGRPASPDGYKLEAVKDAVDPDFPKWAQDAFHKAGLTESQGKALAQQWQEGQISKAKAAKEATEAKGMAELNGLKKEWGAAYDQNRQVAIRAAKEFGISSDVIDAMEAKAGTQATIKFFHSIGEKIGDARFLSGGPSDAGMGVLTPGQALSKIAALKADPEFSKKYTSGDAKARLELETLHKYAYPDAS